MKKIIYSLLFILFFLNGDYRLISAAKSGNIEKVKRILKKGVKNINDGGKNSWSALTHASFKGYYKIVKILIDAGANVDHVTRSSWTVMRCGARSGNLEVVKLLLSKVTNKQQSLTEAMIGASCSGNIKILKYLLEQGANINGKDSRSQATALHAASSHCGNLKTVKFLVDKGANVNAKDKEGKTPLSVSVSRGKFNITKLLVKQGANINYETKNGDNSLLDSCRNKHFKIARFLIDKGLNINIQNKKGETPLMLIAAHLNFDMVNFLLKKGADIHLEDKSGATAFIYLTKGIKFYYPDRRKKRICQINGLEIANLLKTKNIKNPLFYSDIVKLLQIAANREYLSVIEFIVTSKVKILEDDFKNILIGAIDNKSSMKIIKFLTDKIKSKRYLGEALVIAAANRTYFNDSHNIRDNLEVVKFIYKKYRGGLIERFIRKIKKENKNYTYYLEKSLRSAASSGDLKIVEFLVDKGVNVNRKHDRSDSNKGLTAIYYAFFYTGKRDKIIKFLLKNGADINAIENKEFIERLKSYIEKSNLDH